MRLAIAGKRFAIKSIRCFGVLRGYAFRRNNLLSLLLNAIDMACVDLFNGVRRTVADWMRPAQPGDPDLVGRRRRGGLLVLIRVVTGFTPGFRVSERWRVARGERVPGGDIHFIEYAGLAAFAARGANFEPRAAGKRMIRPIMVPNPMPTSKPATPWRVNSGRRVSFRSMPPPLQHAASLNQVDQ